MSDVWTKEDEENLQRTTSDYNSLTSRKSQYEKKNADALAVAAGEIIVTYNEVSLSYILEDSDALLTALKTNAKAVCAALKPFAEGAA